MYKKIQNSKYGQIWPHIRWPYPAGYENMARFRMISGATLANSTLKY